MEFLFLLICLGWFLVELVGCAVRRGERLTCLAWVGILAATMLVFMPSLHRSDGQTRGIHKSLCRSNLKQIYLTIAMYAADNDGYLPPSLDTLAVANELDVKLCECPAVRRAHEDRKTEVIPQCDYIYYPGGKLDADPDRLLLSDREGNHPGDYKNLVYADGSMNPYFREGWN